MSHEVLHELAHQGEVAGLDNEQLPVQDQQVHVQMGEYDRPHGHSIKLNEGHVHGPDCHEHHQPGAGRIEHNHEACGVDHPEHSGAHKHGGPHSHLGHDHRAHTESQPRHALHIEQNPHACKADCLEHNDTDHAPHGHHIEAKSYEHRCDPDCPDHTHAHDDHAHKTSTAEVRPHDSHAPEAVRAEQNEPHHGELPAYQRIEEVARRSQQAEPAPERVITRTDSADDMPETERASQDEPQAMSRQPVNEIFVAVTPIILEASVSAVNITEAPVEPLLPDETLGAVEVQLVGIADPNAAPVPGIYVAEAEITSLAEAPAIPDVELMQPSDVMELNDGTEAIAYTEMLGDVDVDDIEALEPFEDIGIACIELPMPEPVLEMYQDGVNMEPYNIRADPANMAAPSQPRTEQVLSGYEQAAQGLVELISQRIDAAAEQMPAAMPLRAQALQKTLHTLAELQSAPVNEGSAEARQQQLLRLLQLLGYENPSQTLKAYIHQYGIDFVGELQAKLLELLGQGRVYESLPTSLSAPAVVLSGSDTSALGTLALTLARLRGYLFPATSGV